MATTIGVKNSTNFAFYVGATKVAKQTDAGLEASTDERDITSKDSNNYQELIPGLKSGSFSVSGLWADTGFTVPDLLGLWVNDTVGTNKFGDGTNDVTVDSWMTNISIQSPGAAQNVIFNSTFRWCGEPTIT